MKAGLRTFYTLVISQTVSLIGSQISGLALGIWVFNQTGDATPLALVSFFTIVPRIALSNVAGVLADRWDRRLVMALADVGQAIGTLLLLGLFMADSLQIWHLYLVTALQSLFAVFQQPAFLASITMLVPDEQRDRANAIRQLSEPASGVVAPAIAGVIFAFSGVVGAIIIDLVTFVFAVLVIFFVDIPMPEKTQEGEALGGSIMKEVMGGFHYLWQRQVLFWVMMCIMLLNFVLNIAGVLFTPYILARTNSEVSYGVILSLFNVGMLIGGIVMGIWGGTRPRVHTIMPAAIILSILFALIGVAQSTISLAAISLIALIPNPFINASFMSMMQAKIAPDIQGRVFAALDQMAMMLSPIGYLAAGPLADRIFEPMVGGENWHFFAPLVGDQVGSGMGLIFLISGGLALIVTILMYAHPAVRSMETTLPDYEVVEEDQVVEMQPQVVTA